MPIENRKLAVGTVLVARYKQQDRRCDVVETPDGVRYRLDDGSEHKSPSSAGKAAMDGTACNGWRFWSVQGMKPPARRERKPKTETTTSPKARPRKKPAKKKSAATKAGARQAERRDGARRVTGRPTKLRRLRTNLRTMRAATNHATPRTRS